MTTQDSLSPKRLLELDAAKGLIMILMALDHSMALMAHVHVSEMWARPMTDYSGSLLVFFTRWVTHLCAPGFALLMGAGMILFAESRIKRGWGTGSLIRHFLVRGLILIVVSLTVEDLFWNWGYLLRPGGPKWFVFVTIIATLGASMIVGSFLIRLRSFWLLILSMVCVAGTTFMLPLGLPIKEVAGTITIPETLLFVPWEFMTPAGPAIMAYPIIPWLGITLAGMALGHFLVDHGEKVLQKMHLVGGGLLVAFVAVRFTGVIGNINNLKPSGLISFLSITKYPPSIAFVLLTLGGILIAMAFFNRIASSMDRYDPLLVFGRVPFFFYIIHIALFCVLGKFLDVTGYSAGYLAWVSVLVVLYWPCRWYGEFKKSTSPESIWRLF